MNATGIGWLLVLADLSFSWQFSLSPRPGHTSHRCVLQACPATTVRSCSSLDREVRHLFSFLLLVPFTCYVYPNVCTCDASMVTLKSICPLHLRSPRVSLKVPWTLLFLLVLIFDSLVQFKALDKLSLPLTEHNWYSTLFSYRSLPPELTLIIRPVASRSMLRKLLAQTHSTFWPFSWGTSNSHWVIYFQQKQVILLDYTTTNIISILYHPFLLFCHNVFYIHCQLPKGDTTTGETSQGLQHNNRLNISTFKSIHR